MDGRREEDTPQSMPLAWRDGGLNTSPNRPAFITPVGWIDGLRLVSSGIILTWKLPHTGEERR